jgi:hypothetical protein
MPKFMKAVTLLNEMNIDYRKLNFLRLTLLKEGGVSTNQAITYGSYSQANNTISISLFLKACQSILKIPRFEETELFNLLKEILASEESYRFDDDI